MNSEYYYNDAQLEASEKRKKRIRKIVYISVSILILIGLVLVPCFLAIL